MSTATKRTIANKVLKAAGFETLTNSATSNELNTLLDLMEDYMLALAGNEGVKVGYIKSSNPDYVEPDEPSGIIDSQVLYVKDMLVYKLLCEYDMPVTPMQAQSYRLAMTYILPELEPPVSRCAPIPLGEGNRTRQSDIVYRPIVYDDEIGITKATDLDFSQ